MKDFLTSWVPIISPLATFLVAIIAFLNVLIARKSLKLLELKEARWYPDFELYHSDSYMRRFPKNNLRVYAVDLRVCNRSDADNSIKELSMFVRFNRGGKVNTNLLIPQISGDPNGIIALAGRKPNETLSSPLFIKAHGVHSGWALFKIEDALLVDANIDICELRAIDANDTPFSLPIVIVRRESDESQ